MTTLRVISIGNSMGVILTKEVLEKLRVSKGDRLHVVEVPDGVHLTPYDPAFVEQMDAAEHVMREDRDALRRLGE